MGQLPSRPWSQLHAGGPSLHGVLEHGEGSPPGLALPQERGRRRLVLATYGLLPTVSSCPWFNKGLCPSQPVGGLQAALVVLLFLCAPVG